MRKIILITILSLIFCGALSADTLTTTDKKEYKGKMVAFKFDMVYFNVHQSGQVYKTQRFPIYDVWKIEFNPPKQEGLESSFEMESNYKKLRRGKRVKKITLNATDKWVDTGIKLRIGQDVLFSVTGSIYIEADKQVYQNGELTLNWNNKKSIPNQPTGAIIARVGKRSDPFYVGDDKAPFHITRKGNLFIGINDYNFSDNSGQFVVNIYY